MYLGLIIIIHSSLLLNNLLAGCAIIPCCETIPEYVIQRIT